MTKMTKMETLLRKLDAPTDLIHWCRENKCRSLMKAIEHDPKWVIWYAYRQGIHETIINRAILATGDKECTRMAYKFLAGKASQDDLEESVLSAYEELSKSPTYDLAWAINGAARICNTDKATNIRHWAEWTVEYGVINHENGKS